MTQNEHRHIPDGFVILYDFMDKPFSSMNMEMKLRKGVENE